MRPPATFCFAVLLLASLPTIAGDLPAVERGWRADSARLKGALRDGESIRFAGDGQIVELIRSRHLEDEWLPDEEGRVEVKRTWIGDVWVDGELVGREGVVATTFGPHTWTTIHGPRGTTVLFPDGRTEYAEYGPLACGTETALTTVADHSVTAAAAPPQPVEILDAVFYTPRVESYWGTGTAKARLLNVQDDHNLNLEQSGLSHVKVRFVGFHRDTTYRDSQVADPKNGLRFFSDRTKQYRKLRKLYRADLMTLFAYDMPHDRPTHYSGIALLLGPYKLVGVFGYRYSDTYTHELGHNLGLPHALSYVNCPDNPPDFVDGEFVTVMYSGTDVPPIPPGCEPSRITLYSNKDWQYVSPWTGTRYPLGDAKHHEAGVIVKNAPKVAGWMK